MLYAECRAIDTTGINLTCMLPAGCRAVDKMTGMKQLLKESGEPSVKPHVDALCSLLHELLQYQPQQRITAHQALQHDFFHAEHDVVDLTDS